METYIRPTQLVSSKGKDGQTIAGLLPMSLPTLWRHTKHGLLPPPVKLGPRVSAYIASEIQTVLNARNRGANDTVIRELVRQLVAARGK